MKKEERLKTAEELNIEQPVYDALLDVMEGLKTGKYIHCPGAGKNIQVQETEGNWFGMLYWGNNDCKTVACIGGWMERKLGGCIEFDYPNTYNLLYRLFFPGRHIDWDSITPLRAAEGIRVFLTKGEINWLTVKGVKSFIQKPLMLERSI